MLKALAANNADAIALSLEINDGKILYNNDLANRSAAIEHIDASASGGGQPRMDGSFKPVRSRSALFIGYRSGVANVAADAVPSTFKLYANDKNQLQWQGGVNLAGDTPKSSGTLHLNLENILSWMKAKRPPKNPNMVEQVTKRSQGSGLKTALPLKIFRRLVAGWACRVDGQYAACRD